MGAGTLGGGGRFPFLDPIFPFLGLPSPVLHREAHASSRARRAENGGRRAGGERKGADWSRGEGVEGSRRRRAGPVYSHLAASGGDQQVLSKLTLRGPCFGACHPGALAVPPREASALSLDSSSPRLGVCRQRWQQPLLHEPSNHFCQFVGAGCLSTRPAASRSVFTASALPALDRWARSLCGSAPHAQGMGKWFKCVLTASFAAPTKFPNPPSAGGAVRAAGNMPLDGGGNMYTAE